MKSKEVNIIGCTYRMSEVDGGVMFSKQFPSIGAARYMFEYQANMWYLVEIAKTHPDISLLHLVKMHEHLQEIKADFSQILSKMFDGKPLCDVPRRANRGN